MVNYEIIAFYKENKEEVLIHAEALKEKLNLDLRYEKMPSNRKSTRKLVTENTVLSIFNRTTMNYRTLLKYVYEIPGPVLLVSPSDSLESYDKLKIPVGYLMENKEKVVWANFLQKKNSSIAIELLIPTEKDDNIRSMVASNVRFMENVLDNSNSVYTKSLIDKGFEDLLKTTFVNTKDGVVLVMRPFRVFSFFIPPNLRLYDSHGRSQVLLIPRDDELYVPCH
ncbi:hypothetical protein LJC12_00600 [Odoribacter sp. OttesenSCG-928-J03]|nr:hypothetical protein [Odoribacter sp. OttesenSCG-928-J03]